MANHIGDVAHRIKSWADRISINVERTAGYCMSGSWNNYYCRLLFPEKRLEPTRLYDLIQELKRLGFDASLSIVPFESDTGLHMHMQLRRISNRFETAELLVLDAESVRLNWADDPRLPSKSDFVKMHEDPSIIPASFRNLKLVFPNAIDKGLSEGGAKVTDDSIGMLTWNGEKWEASWLLAGPDGWCCKGPDFCPEGSHVLLYKYN